jgi:hypothetical protein
MQIKVILLSWDQLLCAFFEKVRRQAFQPILQNVFCVLITTQSLASQKFLDVEKQVINTWCKVGTVHRML